VQDVSVWPLDNSGHGAADLVHRFQWVTPLMLSPHNPDVLYTAGEAVFKSADHGQSWTQISGDLTRNDKSKQQPSGGPLTNDITSVEYYDTVFALAECSGPERTMDCSTSQLTTASIGRRSPRKCRSGALSILLIRLRTTATPLTSR
jgi:hypothetical protein